MSYVICRDVEISDFEDVTKFVDYWLSGRAIKEGGGNDYFVTRNQHKAYFKNCKVVIAIEDKKIIGWGVKGKNNVLIHLLVAGTHRGKGIGKRIMLKLNPDIIRSKSDQQTGNPKGFYESLGYKSVIDSMVGKKSNIELMTK